MMYREIARGAQDYLGKRCAREDFLDVTQIVADEAWKKALADPGCFARGELRKWATRAARWRYKDMLAERRKHALAQLALQREYEAGNFDAQLVDAAIEEAEERPRAIARGLQLLEPVSEWAVIEVYLRGRSRREAAAELGITRGKLDRKIEKALRFLARVLSALDSRAPRETERSAPILRERGDR
jgi:RNA polymerase sigma factor (sigma-70 family)